MIIVYFHMYFTLAALRSLPEWGDPAGPRWRPSLEAPYSVIHYSATIGRTSSWEACFSIYAGASKSALKHDAASWKLYETEVSLYPDQHNSFRFGCKLLYDLDDTSNELTMPNVDFEISRQTIYSLDDPVLGRTLDPTPTLQGYWLFQCPQDHVPLIHEIDALDFAGSREGLCVYDSAESAGEYRQAYEDYERYMRGYAILQDIERRASQEISGLMLLASLADGG